MSTIDKHFFKEETKKYKANKMYGKRHSAWMTFVYAFLILLTITSLFPMVWLINFSLVKSGELYGSEFLKWPNPFQWVNYERAWVDGQILHYFINSVIVVGLSVFLSVLFSFMLAYACTRMEWKLRTLVYGIVLTGMMIPIHATLLPNYQLFNVFGLLDTYPGLIIPYIAFTLPFNTLMLGGFLQSVHRSLEESALIDGCTNWGVMFRIVAPIVKPAIVTTTIITFINNWNEFIMAKVYLRTENIRTLPFAVLKFNGEYSAQYAIQFAVMVCVAIPSLLTYFILSKYITEAVSQGAVKG
jgi:raffinose/stachyose/melibiose transport system permease protein